MHKAIVKSVVFFVNSNEGEKYLSRNNIQPYIEVLYISEFLYHFYFKHLFYRYFIVIYGSKGEVCGCILRISVL